MAEQSTREENRFWDPVRQTFYVVDDSDYEDDDLIREWVCGGPKKQQASPRSPISLSTQKQETPKKAEQSSISQKFWDPVRQVFCTLDDSDEDGGRIRENVCKQSQPSPDSPGSPACSSTPKQKEFGMNHSVNMSGDGTRDKQKQTQYLLTVDCRTFERQKEFAMFDNDGRGHAAMDKQKPKARRNLQSDLMPGLVAEIPSSLSDEVDQAIQESEKSAKFCASSPSRKSNIPDIEGIREETVLGMQESKAKKSCQCNDTSSSPTGQHAQCLRDEVKQAIQEEQHELAEHVASSSNGQFNREDIHGQAITGNQKPKEREGIRTHRLTPSNHGPSLRDRKYQANSITYPSSSDSATESSKFFVPRRRRSKSRKPNVATEDRVVSDQMNLPTDGHVRRGEKVDGKDCVMAATMAAMNKTAPFITPRSRNRMSKTL